MANIVEPGKTVCHKLSHLDLHCLHRYLFCSAELKALTALVLYVSLLSMEMQLNNKPFFFNSKNMYFTRFAHLIFKSLQWPIFHSGFI